MAKIQVFCEECGASIWRYKCEIRERVFCSRACYKKFLSQRMTAMNQELNPGRMIPETREKVRKSRLNSGKGYCYTKLYGRHEHRAVAEVMLGRTLKPKEVVHHIDKNKRNNNPENLIVFASQSDHAFWHKIEEEIMLDFGNI